MSTQNRITLAIVGSRTFTDYDLLVETMKSLTSKVVRVVSGGAKGADTLASQWAIENHVPLDEFIPNWELYGKSAGFKRNTNIIAEADALLAFWDAKSKGTASSIKLAEAKDIPVRVVLFGKGAV